MNLFSNYENFSQKSQLDAGLLAYRQLAYAHASQLSLPTRKDEDWHYTSVKPIAEGSFSISLAQSNEVDLQDLKKRLNPAFCNLVFVNGLFAAKHSDELPQGITLVEYSAANLSFDDAFDAINASYITKPLCVKIAAEASVAKPLHILSYVAAEGSENLMVHPRITIEAGARSSATVLETYYGGKGISYLSNSVTDIEVKDSAKLCYIRVVGDSDAAFNIGRTRIQVAQNANLESLAFTTGAKLSRHSLDINLVGKGSHSEILGVYAVNGDQHVDNTSLINHVVGECDTQQLYKGILDGNSKAAFVGKVLIQKYAQKANSSQLNNNLLLSTKAEADSKPCLEIYADDVKAAHGSTVGQLNKEELFYLQSRCISKEKAIPMLSYGFLSEVIYKLSNESVQKWLSLQLDEAFAKFNVNR